MAEVINRRLTFRALDWDQVVWPTRALTIYADVLLRILIHVNQRQMQGLSAPRAPAHFRVLFY